MPLKVSVIICAYTLDRWRDLSAAVRSVRTQHSPPDEIIVIIDHNAELLARARNSFPSALVIGNAQSRGLSGARNTGIAAASGDLIAFLDDDAIADPDWLSTMLAHFETLDVLGAGSRIEPSWEIQRAWFPVEFHWVVGCSYRGMPENVAPVRNLIGASMCIRREVFEVVGGFHSGLGRVGAIPLGCEETELCIRAGHEWPGRRFVYDPKSAVRHHVPASRVTWRYFRSRCYAEGLSKALIAQLVGASAGLSSERTYVTRTLPGGIIRGLSDAVLRGDGYGLLRAAAITLGLAITALGYIVGTVWLRVGRREHGVTSPIQMMEAKEEA